MQDKLQNFAGQFPQTRDEAVTMRAILNSMRPHFIFNKRAKYKRPPAKKKELIKENPEFDVVPQYKKVIFIEPKYQKGTYTPIKKEIETTVCKFCDSDTLNGDYCGEQCRYKDLIKQTA